MLTQKRNLKIFTSTVAILAFASPVVVAGDVADIKVLFSLIRLNLRLVSRIYAGDRWVSPLTSIGAAAPNRMDVWAVPVD